MCAFGSCVADLILLARFVGKFLPNDASNPGAIGQAVGEIIKKRQEVLKAVADSIYDSATSDEKLLEVYLPAMRRLPVMPLASPVTSLALCCNLCDCSVHCCSTFVLSTHAFFVPTTLQDWDRRCYTTVSPLAFLAWSGVHCRCYHHSNSASWSGVWTGASEMLD